MSSSRYLENGRLTLTKIVVTDFLNKPNSIINEKNVHHEKGPKFTATSHKRKWLAVQSKATGDVNEQDIWGQCSLHH